MIGLRCDKCFYICVRLNHFFWLLIAIELLLHELVQVVCHLRHLVGALFRGRRGRSLSIRHPSTSG